jgi:hypothetical protein
LLLSGDTSSREKILEGLRAYSTLFFHQEKSFHDDALISRLEAGLWLCRRG